MQRQVRDAQPVQQALDVRHGNRRRQRVLRRLGRDQHRFEHPQVYGGGQALRQIDHMPGALAHAQAGHVLAVQQDAALPCADQSGQRFQQGGFSAAVRAQQGGHVARGKRRHRQRVQHVVAAIAGGQPVDVQRGVARHGNCRRNTTATKKGMPTSAVTMPTGTTTPGSRFLETTEASDRISAPTRALPGR
ncbi:hypothetical protein G6F65_019981 [Rhizopus arrhizus]|nr:hypothetical protein G6F65_019981 [Rhizopus arrhizus]